MLIVTVTFPKADSVWFLVIRITIKLLLATFTCNYLYSNSKAFNIWAQVTFMTKCHVNTKVVDIKSHSDSTIHLHFLLKKSYNYCGSIQRCSYVCNMVRIRLSLSRIPVIIFFSNRLIWTACIWFNCYRCIIVYSNYSIVLGVGKRKLFVTRAYILKCLCPP